jgi:hypothetical protein
VLPQRYFFGRELSALQKNEFFRYEKMQLCKIEKYAGLHDLVVSDELIILMNHHIFRHGALNIFMMEFESDCVYSHPRKHQLDSYMLYYGYNEMRPIGNFIFHIGDIIPNIIHYVYCRYAINNYYADKYGPLPLGGYFGAISGANFTPSMNYRYLMNFVDREWRLERPYHGVEILTNTPNWPKNEFFYTLYRECHLLRYVRNAMI